MNFYTGNYRQNPHYKGCARLDDTQAPITAILTDSATWYKLSDNIVDGDCVGFELDGSGTLTYTGPNGKVFLFVGNANIKADKVCDVTFALYKNGLIKSDAKTPVTFDHANSYQQISINRGLSLNHGDTLEVFANSSVNTTALNVFFFSISFWGE